MCFLSPAGKADAMREGVLQRWGRIQAEGKLGLGVKGKTKRQCFQGAAVATSVPGC